MDSLLFNRYEVDMVFDIYKRGQGKTRGSAVHLPQQYLPDWAVCSFTKN